ncbi:hypothetical protein AB1Y20_015575 [Prymnesium parvum]|uniref:Uncharacterized protein n=1 Tax=Prymnesium parvum TaxID=97485 RepID=A0AB34K3D8_PRYPA
MKCAEGEAPADRSARVRALLQRTRAAAGGAQPARAAATRSDTTGACARWDALQAEVDLLDAQLELERASLLSSGVEEAHHLSSGVEEAPRPLERASVLSASEGEAHALLSSAEREAHLCPSSGVREAEGRGACDARLERLAAELRAERQARLALEERVAGWMREEARARRRVEEQLLLLVRQAARAHAAEARGGAPRSRSRESALDELAR